MSDSEEEEENESGVEKYIVHGLFGSEDNQSLLRVVASTKSETAKKVCDQVMAWRASKRDDLGLFKEGKNVLEFIPEGADKKEVAQVIRNLVYNGVLVVSSTAHKNEEE